MTTKTKWFPASQDPWESGVYEREYNSWSGDYQYWDGQNWYYGSNDVVDTFKIGVNPDKRLAVLHVNRRWRGLANDPKEK